MSNHNQDKRRLFVLLYVDTEDALSFIDSKDSARADSNLKSIEPDPAAGNGEFAETKPLHLESSKPGSSEGKFSLVPLVLSPSTSQELTALELHELVAKKLKTLDLKNVMLWCPTRLIAARDVSSLDKYDLFEITSDDAVLTALWYLQLQQDLLVDASSRGPHDNSSAGPPTTAQSGRNQGQPLLIVRRSKYPLGQEKLLKERLLASSDRPRQTAKAADDHSTKKSKVISADDQSPGNGDHKKPKRKGKDGHEDSNKLKPLPERNAEQHGPNAPRVKNMRTELATDWGVDESTFEVLNSVEIICKFVTDGKECNKLLRMSKPFTLHNFTRHYCRHKVVQHRHAKVQEGETPSLASPYSGGRHTSDGTGKKKKKKQRAASDDTESDGMVGPDSKKRSRMILRMVVNHGVPRAHFKIVNSQLIRCEFPQSSSEACGGLYKLARPYEYHDFLRHYRRHLSGSSGPASSHKRKRDELSPNEDDAPRARKRRSKSLNQKLLDLKIPKESFEVHGLEMIKCLVCGSCIKLSVPNMATNFVKHFRRMHVGITLEDIMVAAQHHRTVDWSDAEAEYRDKANKSRDEYKKLKKRMKREGFDESTYRIVDHDTVICQIPVNDSGQTCGVKVVSAYFDSADGFARHAALSHPKGDEMSVEVEDKTGSDGVDVAGMESALREVGILSEHFNLVNDSCIRCQFVASAKKKDESSAAVDESARCKAEIHLEGPFDIEAFVRHFKSHKKDLPKEQIPSDFDSSDEESDNDKARRKRQRSLSKKSKKQKAGSDSERSSSDSDRSNDESGSSGSEDDSGTSGDGSSSDGSGSSSSGSSDSDSGDSDSSSGSDSESDGSDMDVEGEANADPDKKGKSRKNAAKRMERMRSLILRKGIPEKHFKILEPAVIECLYEDGSGEPVCRRSIRTPIGNFVIHYRRVHLRERRVSGAPRDEESMIAEIKKAGISEDGYRVVDSRSIRCQFDLENGARCGRQINLQRPYQVRNFIGHFKTHERVDGKSNGSSTPAVKKKAIAADFSDVQNLENEIEDAGIAKDHFNVLDNNLIVCKYPGEGSNNSCNVQMKLSGDNKTARYIHHYRTIHGSPTPVDNQNKPDRRDSNDSLHQSSPRPSDDLETQTQHISGHILA